VLAVSAGVCLATSALAHNLDTRATSIHYAADYLALMSQRAAANQALTQVGDEFWVVIKTTPGPGTTTGVGGYQTFYVPSWAQVLDAAYVLPDPSAATGFVTIPMKGQSPIAIGSGPAGAKTTPELIGYSLPGTNGLGFVTEPVTAAGLHRGTIAGVYADTGIFYSTDPRTGFNTYGAALSGGTPPLVNNSGDTVGEWDAANVADPTVLGVMTLWDSHQLRAYGNKAGPVIDYPDQRGNAPWGLANVVAGPQSGYAWEFNYDTYLATSGTAAQKIQAAIQIGPWRRIQYPGGQIASDQPGLISSALGYAAVDASTMGYDLNPANPLPADAKAVRFAIGQLELGRPEFSAVKVKILSNPSANCTRIYGDAFGGDAGGTDGGKDHIWRYFDPTVVSLSPCTFLQKTVSKALVAPGEVFYYTIVFANNGTVALPNIALRDTLPSGVTFLSAQPPPTSVAAPTYTWNLGTVQPGSMVVITNWVKAASLGTHFNNVTAFSGAELLGSVNQAVEVGYRSLLQKAKTVTPAAIAPGETVDYTITVSNDGTGGNGVPLIVRDYLPSGFTFANLLTATLNGAAIASPTITVNAVDPAVPVFTVSQAIQPGKTLVIAFRALAGSAVEPGSYFNNVEMLYEGKRQPPIPEAMVTVAGGKIGDTVYRDWNGNGAQDSGEEGMAGLAVKLYAADGTTLLATTTTDANGRYYFPGLTAGTYVVKVNEGTTPAGHTQTADPDASLDNMHTVVLTADEQYLAADFGYRPAGTATIGDTVFEDIGKDGLFHSGADVGIPNVTVWLYEDGNGNGVVDAGDALVATTQSDSNGDYLFSNLAAGYNYLVKVDQSDPDLQSYFNSTYDPAPVPYALSTAEVVSSPNLTGNDLDNDFGFWKVVPGSIGDRVFYDANNDGVYDAGDAPLAGLRVRLYVDADLDGVPDASELYAETTTDGTGSYLFSALPAANYLVAVDPRDAALPAGLVASRTLWPVPLASGETVLTADFPFVALLTKTVDKPHAAVGELLTYTLTATPSSANPVQNLQVRDVLPTGAVFSAASHGGSYNAETRTVTWPLGTTSNGVPGTITDAPNIYALRGDGKQDFWRYTVTSGVWTAAANYGANVKEGGALVFAPANGLVYGMRGANTKEFRSYNPANNTWTVRASLTSTANVNVGGALAYQVVGGTAFVYALVGNGSAEFLRYSVTGNTWLARASVPSAVGAGGTLASDGTYLYALSGNGGTGFHRFNPADNTWQTLAPAPAGIGAGGALAYNINDGVKSLYALRGGGQRQFYRYDVAANTWSTLAPFPNNVNRGGALTVRANRIYGLRGDKKKEFHRYNPVDNTWLRLADVLADVTWGGALASVGGVAQRDTLIEPEQYVARSGDTLTVHVDLSQCNNCPDPVYAATPPALVVTAIGGASATYVSGPTPAPQDILIGQTKRYAYTYTVTAGAAAVPQSLVFSIPTNFVTATPSVEFAKATSASVVVVPTLTVSATVATGFAGVVTNAATLSGQTQTGVGECYLIANHGAGGTDDVDHLIHVSADGVVTDIGPTGTTGARSAVWAPDVSRLFTADGARFGSLDINTGVFAEIGRIVKTDGTTDENNLEGAQGGIAAASLNVVGMTFDPATGLLYAVHRRAGSTTDLLFRLNPDTGLHVENAFGTNIDYVQLGTIGGRGDIDDLRFDPAGTLYGILSDGATSGGIGDLLVTINKATGATTAVTLTDVNTTGFVWIDTNGDGDFDSGEELRDVEGFSITPEGYARITVGKDGGARAGLVYQIDLESGEVSLDGTPGAHSDYEAIVCRDHTVFQAPAEAQTGVGNMIGDRVWIDDDGDGLQDEGEPGLANVSVLLYDASGAVLLATAVTDASGHYTFAGLANGTYSVRYDPATVPAGYHATTPVMIDGIALSDASERLDIDFGLQPPGQGSLGDRVWLDADGDGMQDADEAGLPDIAVSLEKWVDGTWLAVASAQTDAAGSFAFGSLSDGDYRVSVDTNSLVASPYGGSYALGGAMAPTYDLDGTGTANAALVTLNETQRVYDTLDFGYNWSGSIGDYVWWDADADGVQDVGEDPVTNAFVMVYIDFNGNGILDPNFGDYQIAFALTDANGQYLIGNLPPGPYLVDVYEDSLTTGGIRDIVPTTLDVVYHQLGPGEAFLAADFGYYQGARVEGNVFWDDNRNAYFEGVEAGLTNVTVTLVGTDLAGNPVSRTTTTDADGHFAFLVPEGDYTLTYSNASLLAGYPSLGDATTPTSYTFHAYPGEDGNRTSYDFGVDNSGRLGDTVFADVNGTPGQQAGEAGLAGVTVRLYANPDGSAALSGDEILLEVALTDAEGRYLFLGLADGHYLVEVVTATLPGGFATTPTTDPTGALDSQGTATITGGSSVLTLDFGYPLTPLSYSVSGTLYDDNGAGGGTAGNGTQEGAEPGLANVRLTIEVGTNGVYQTFVVYTDSNGDYDLLGVPEGSDVRITVDASTLPNSAYVQTGDPDGAPLSGVWTITDLQANANSLDFGYRAQYGSIAGTVVDGDGNGTADFGEPALTDVTVTLLYAGADGIFGTGDDTTAFTATDATGAYSFTNLVPGNYRVLETDPAGYVSLADADGGNPNIIDVPALQPGQNVMGRDFEDTQPDRYLGDLVWHDLNGDGVQDAGEPGLAGVTVRLYSAGADGIFGTGDDVLEDTDTTDASGEYRFEGLAPASYWVEVVAASLPAGFADYPSYDVDSVSTPHLAIVTLGADAGRLDADFGYYPRAVIGNFVWEDLNGNGTQDAGEPGMTNVTVRLYDSASNLVATAQTDTNGVYAFTNLLPGSYFVQAVPPPGYTNTLTQAGGDTSLDSDMNDAGWSGVVTVISGETKNDVDFGMYLPAVVRGYVFRDANGDLLRNAGDVHLTNVLVRLLVGGVEYASVTNDALGYYEFVGVPAGTVSVLVTRAGGTLTGVPVEEPDASAEARNRALPDESGLDAYIVHSVVSGQGVLADHPAETLNFGFLVTPLSTALDISLYASGDAVTIEIWTVNESGHADIVIYAWIGNEWVEVGRVPGAEVKGEGSNRYQVRAAGLAPGASYNFKIVDEAGHVHYSAGPLEVRTIRMEGVRLNMETVTVAFNTEPGRRYTLLASTDLVNWTPEFVSRRTTTGWSAFTDETFTAGASRTEVLIPVNARAKAFFKVMMLQE
jgi:uncharacterized repeat protein (TIGR01451 family)